MATITSANAIFKLSIPGLAGVPFQLQGYAVDDAFGAEDVSPVEARMGVDGRKSAGFTPYMTKVQVHLMPDSDSIDVFDNWNLALYAAQDDVPCSATIDSPALGKSWSFNNGSLTRFKPVSDAKKVQESQSYEITFESFTVQAI
jgi:hypothetical protein